ncbi:MAG: hypothetical protein Q9165_005885 [Trypethelium subeluteriae]
MAPKTDGITLSPQETTLLVNFIRHKTGNITDMTDWNLVAADSGYKNAANARTMFSRLCKNKLERSSNSSGGPETPSGGVGKAGTSQGPKTNSKKATSKSAKQAKVKEESDGTDDEAAYEAIVKEE